MTIQTKRADEFGRTVTLYRAVTDDGKWGTLWHSTCEKAVAAYRRRYPAAIFDRLPVPEDGYMGWK